MDRTDCLRDKLSSRTVGFILLGFSLIIAFAGFLIVPVLGVFFAMPLLVLAGVFIAAPESKVCRLITGKKRGIAFIPIPKAWSSEPGYFKFS
jgi:hypothetical protein